jgi:FAD/FMN-containing dehydrogenase
MHFQPSLLSEEKLSGWGRCPLVKSYVSQHKSVSSIESWLQFVGRWAVLPRGAGRSYGDAALNSQGYTLLTESLNRIIDFNPQTGILRCEAGVTFKQINETFVPMGWFPAVTPGTKFPTMGGAIASDVHGKNHHVDGSFSRHVHSIKIILASGETVVCSRHENSDLFWATVGGMGLTGIITEVEIALRPVETAYINSHQVRARNLEEAFKLFDLYEPRYQYSVAWLDCLSSGRSLGRSILMFGNHATPDELPPKLKQNPLKIKQKPHFQVSFDLPSGLLNRFTVGAFNTFYYYLQSAKPEQFIVDYDSYFYPLDSIWSWNRLYGKRGFLQYQFVVPLETSWEAITQILSRLNCTGWGSFLTVLKRLGPQEGWLSFPMPGYTMTLDIPVRQGVWEFLDELDQIIIQHKGRVYLAKDARLQPETFRTMYPDFPQWHKVKSAVDSDYKLSSAMSRRLQINKLNP